MHVHCCRINNMKAKTKSGVFIGPPVIKHESSKVRGNNGRPFNINTNKI